MLYFHPPARGQPCFGYRIALIYLDYPFSRRQVNFILSGVKTLGHLMQIISKRECDSAIASSRQTLSHYMDLIAVTPQSHLKPSVTLSSLAALGRMTLVWKTFKIVAKHPSPRNLNAKAMRDGLFSIIVTFVLSKCKSPGAIGFVFFYAIAT